MLYCLWFTDNFIHLGTREEDSNYTILPEAYGRRRHGWRQMVAELANLVHNRHEGRITDLEIQSHGHPAEIVVGHKPNITHESVALFGAMLRPLMAPGGLIQVLCCDVAAVDSSCAEGGPSQYSEAVRAAYFGELEKLEKREEYLGPLKALRNQHLRPEGDGLGFCLELARTSGAIVRAAADSQIEEARSYYNPRGREYADTNVIMNDFDSIGDWEGPVWDFMPNGEVRFLGVNFPRHKFPKHSVGPRLAGVLRDQGGHQRAHVGQRPQRLNRSPLAV